MRIRFLETTASAHPQYPFQAGQIITLPRLSPEMRQWLREGRVEVLGGDVEELAMVGAAPEQATAIRPRARGMR